MNLHTRRRDYRRWLQRQQEALRPGFRDRLRAGEVSDEEVIFAIRSAPVHRSGIAHVQTVPLAPNGTASSISVTLANTTTGNFLLAAIALFPGAGTAATVTSITNVPNTWVQAKRQTAAAGNSSSIDLYYAKNITGQTTPAIAANLNKASFRTMAVSEFSGVDTASPLDQTNGGLGSSGAVSTGTVTTATGGELYAAGMSCDASPTISAWNWTDRYHVINGSGETAAYQTQGDTSNVVAGTYSGTWSLSGGAWAAAVATFLAATAAASPVWGWEPVGQERPDTRIIPVAC